MVLAMAKALILLQLSMLCFTVFSEETEAVPPVPPKHHGSYPHPAAAPSPHHHHQHHHHGHPPNHAPVHPPTYPPTHAPVHPPLPHTQPPVPPPKPSPPMPVHPPVKPPPYPPNYHFPRSFVAVQGVVYCKSCKYAGVETLLGATPVLGATVKLQCYNTKYKVEAKATTDKNGYFFLQAPKTVTNYGAHKCKVFLVSSPNISCSKPSGLHGGLTGGILRPEKPFVANKLPFFLYTVGPFAFEPKCPH